jgi:hypothetical protein
MTEKREVNEYLFYEFCYDLGHEPSEVAEDWPFQLKELGTIRTHEGERRLFEFVYKGDPYVVVSGPITASYPAAGMKPGDFEIQLDGGEWLEQQGPVDLKTSVLGDDNVPPQPERKAAILSLAAPATRNPHICIGLYLRTTGRYLALVEDRDTGEAILIGTDVVPRNVGFPEASPGRRLAYAVGLLLEDKVAKAGSSLNEGD